MGVKHLRLWSFAALGWGFAEATFFFLVPDILLTAAVLSLGLAIALRLAMIAAAGAVAGGLAMVMLGASDPETARTLVNAVPLIGDDLMSRVRAEIAGFWPVNLVRGAVTGAPYKIYAVEAGAADINAVAFAGVSFVARSLRFALAILIAGGLFHLAARVGRPGWRLPGLIMFWLALYASYAAWRLSVS